MITIACANALNIPLADKSVQCVVTSSPYWSLRDYGVAGQIGLESTPAAYVAHIVAVMRECWRVLKDDGVLWLNLGDSYAANRGYQVPDTKWRDVGNNHSSNVPDGLKPKDLCGIPWRVAFALQDDGWYLRSDIIWSKPNPMPESVTDRPTKAHEYVFMLTKRARYYYDAIAIQEEANYDGRKDTTIKPAEKYNGRQMIDGQQPQQLGRGIEAERWPNVLENGARGRNRRSVWTVATQPYSGAHFATFPPALIEPMILAGTSARGECPHCGKAWVRVLEVTKSWRENAYDDNNSQTYRNGSGNRTARPQSGGMSQNESTTTGWRPQCDCPPHEPIPQTVLDPFAGSGTTGAVAVKHGRRAVLLDLNTKYIDLQFDRTNGIQITMQM